MTKKKKRANQHRKNEITRGIFEVLEKEPNKSFNYKQIASKLEINDTEGRNILIKRLGQLKAKERIREFEKGKYKSLENKILHEGKIEVTARGNAYVIVDGLDDDIFISNNKINRAFDGDIVEVLVKPKRKSNKLEGEVVNILKRKKNNFVGILDLHKSFAFVRPTDHKMYTDIFVPINLVGKAKDGEKVIVEILSWEADAESPTGKVVEVLGLPGLHN
ncbi:MAG: ribonuclease R, partial [Flavobacteriaceae bacterium]|nr:ribonuclease R [Muriicola sp.]NNL40297.1 ribonuclease R [Flavobacteriaceae bacterium]